MQLNTGSGWLDHAVRHHLAEVFHDELRRSGRESFTLRQAVLDFESRLRGPRTFLTIRFSNNRHARRIIEIPWEEARGMALPPRTDVTWEASRLFSSMLEDHYVEMECADLRAQLEEARRIDAPSERIQHLACVYAERLEHARQYHRTAQVQALDASDALNYASLRDVWRQINRPESAAEQRARYTHEIIEWYRDRVFNHEEGNRYLQSLIGGFNWSDVGTKEAREKGLALLQESLTPFQKAQYEAHKYFDVTGGKSGKTYRIHHGRQMNIHEMDAKGNAVQGWCFLPQGGLVAGDVMLAQKNALELYEDKALKIANKFAVSGIPRAADQPITQADYGRQRLDVLYGTRVATGPGIVNFDVTS